MKRTNNENSFPLIAAICFVLAGLFSMLTGASISAQTIIQCIIFIGLAATVFLKNKKSFLVVTIVMALSYPLLLFFSLHSFFSGSLLYSLPYAMMAVLIILALRETADVIAFWPYPALVILVTSAINLFFLFTQRSIHISSLSPFFAAAALFFTGLWLKNDLSPAISRSEDTSTVSVQRPTDAGREIPVMPGNADTLKTYHELLASGAITQEEFEAKKKQILEL